MASITFTFGRNPRDGSDYFTYAGGKKDYGLPKTLVDSLGTKLKKALENHTWIYFSFNGARNYFGVWPPDLGSVVPNIEWSSILRDSPDTADCSKFLKANHEFLPRVVFGPGTTVFCWTLKKPDRMGASRTRFFWDKPSLWSDLETTLKDSSDNVRTIALGVGGAWWLRFEDETKVEKYQLKSNYPELTKWMVANPRAKIVFLALHPQDPNQFFMVDERNNVRAVLSKDIWNIAKEALKHDEEVGVIGRLNVALVDK